MFILQEIQASTQQGAIVLRLQQRFRKIKTALWGVHTVRLRLCQHLVKVLHSGVLVGRYEFTLSERVRKK